MNLSVRFKFDDNVPIYKQVVEIIKSEIVANKISAGAKLLSIREYSEKFGVNPNTVQKALAELEKDGLIFTERTNGKFITKDVLRLEDIKNKIVSTKINDFLKNMLDIGFDVDEIKEIISQYLVNLKNNNQANNQDGGK